ncbi:hypothetical protein LPJ61_003331 [Coemansia biformis]|uniref:SCP domain-containing protein n=1 Tax=Coemansia biformis TaxID=1286918 RepID=A0A9W7Y6R6_9FUNG|nr:hypothetical protein LPJ61_003331 [Coemansia biformis]
MKFLSLSYLAAPALVLLADVNGVQALPVETLGVVAQVGQYATNAVNAVGKSLGLAKSQPVAKQPAAPAYSDRAPSDQMLCLVNGERRNRGLNPVSIHPTLMRVAYEHSQYQAKTRQMTHANPEYGSVGQRMSRNGFKMKAAAENIAALPGATTKEIFDMWCGEPAHYQNILDPSATYMGIANINGYWTQDFGSSLGQSEPAAYAAAAPAYC